MRKLLFVVVLTSFVAAATAQDNTMMSKRGTPILPEAGDWSIGIDAVPFVDWAFDKTRVFSNTGVTSAGGAVNAQAPMTFVGLYMKDANTAYRARVGINMMSNKQEYNVMINNDSATGSTHSVLDEVKVSQFGITLGAGIQKFRGKGRLHGIYGAEARLMFSGPQKTEVTYGNAFVTDTTNVNLGDAFSINISDTTAGYTSSRITEMETGGGFGFGINGFVGVEYFFAPKMSFSAEYNWGIMISSIKEGTTTTESTYNPSATSSVIAVRTRTDASMTGKNSQFNIMNGDINTSGTGNIVFHFYF
jgi:hypothetical protein